ncbi:tetratricopeptide repeat protein [Actinokineospora auranticolor]|uniref:Tetratricopeptide repeat protein n=1 Tax=Actinokineospora auranticolor TaxID=155976 RepID=A0A2S6GCL0_9PSEU|nr:tetratricopeptide repeat protein [Actinokineospora auranticolor]
MHNAVPGQVSGQVVQAGTVGAINFHAEQADLGIPYQLPPVPAVFAGREAELVELDALTAGGTALVVLTGMGGVGKSTLAAGWARSARDRFPDGQLVAELTDATGGPVSAADAQEWFLLSLSVPAEKIPVEPARRAALFRSVTAGLRLLILLDNALSATQVRALLPTGAGSVVLVTSRSRLSGLALDGARWLPVEPLPPDGALRLLGSVLGVDRVSSEPEAAEELTRLCGGLPLALAVVGARLAARGRRTLSREVRELRDERVRLRGLELDAETSVAVVLDHARDELDGDAVEVYRCCAWHPGREFTVPAVAGALGWQPDRVADALDDLVEANMVAEPTEERFALHDLIRLHARHTAAADREERGMVEWYLGRAVAADLVIHPLREHLGPGYLRPGDPFPDRASAMAWMGAERDNLRAAVNTAARHHWDELVWQLCEAQWGHFLHTRRYGEWIDMQLKGIAAAHRLGERLAEARLHTQAGFAYAKTGSYAEAEAHSHAVVRLAEATGDGPTEATALSQLGRIARETGDLDAAVGYFERARAVHERLGRVRGVALARRRLGELHSRLDRPERAVEELTAAAAAMAELGDQAQYAKAMTLLATVHLGAGDTEEARRILAECLTSIQELESPQYEAEILVHHGDVAAAAEDPTTAAASWARAAHLYEQLQDPRVDEVRARLTRMPKSDT